MTATPRKIHSIGALAQQVVTDVVAKAEKDEAVAKVAKADVNWSRIEVEFRAGIKPLRLIGQEFGVSHTAIAKRAEKEGWTRDIGAKVRAKADEKVAKAAVSKEVSVETKVTESVLIEAESQLQFQIRMLHRKDIARARNLMADLFSEVEQQTANLELFERLGELLDETDINSKGQVIKDQLNVIYRKVIDTPGRVDSTKKLVEILEKTVRLEREAFGIDNGEREKDSVEALLDRIAKKRGLVP